MTASKYGGVQFPSGRAIGSNIIQARQLREARQIELENARMNQKKERNEELWDSLIMRDLIVEDLDGGGLWQINPTANANGEHNQIMLELLSFHDGLMEYPVTENDKIVGYEKIDLSGGNGTLISNTKADGTVEYLIGGVNPEGKPVYFTRGDRSKGSSATEGAKPASFNGTTMNIAFNSALYNLMRGQPDAERTALADAAAEGGFLRRGGGGGEKERLKNQRDLQLSNIRRVKKIKEQAGNDKIKFLEMIADLANDPNLRGSDAFFQFLDEAEDLWTALGGSESVMRGDNIPTITEAAEELQQAAEEVQQEYTLTETGKLQTSGNLTRTKPPGLTDKEADQLLKEAVRQDRVMKTTFSDGFKGDGSKVRETNQILKKTSPMYKKLVAENERLGNPINLETGQLNEGFTANDIVGTVLEWGVMKPDQIEAAIKTGSYYLDPVPQPTGTVDDRGPDFRFTEEELLDPEGEATTEEIIAKHSNPEDIDNYIGTREEVIKLLDLEEEVIPEGASIGGSGSAGGTPTDTGRKTRYGRPIWENSNTGEQYSEKTVTFQLSNGRWINMPSIDEKGMPIPQSQLEDYAEQQIQDNFGGRIKDPITGDVIESYEDEETASGQAELRSNILSTNLVQRAQAAAETNDKDIMRDYFAGKGIETFDAMIKELEKVNPYNRAVAIRAIAGLTSDPDAAIERMESAVRTGFMSTPTGTGTAPAPSDVYKQNLEMVQNLIGARPTGSGFEYNTGETEASWLGSKVTPVVGVLSPTDARTAIRTLAYEIKTADPTGTNPNYRFGRQALQDATLQAHLGEMVIAGQKNWLGRVAPFGWFGNEPMFKSDAIRDNIFQALGGNPHFQGDTVNPRVDDIRLLIGEGLAKDGGADIGGNNFPRVAVFNSDGKETTASTPLMSMIFNSYSGDPEMAEAALQKMIPEKDFQRYKIWKASRGYEEMRKAYGTVSQGAEPTVTGALGTLKRPGFTYTSPLRDN